MIIDVIRGSPTNAASCGVLAVLKPVTVLLLGTGMVRLGFARRRRNAQLIPYTPTRSHFCGVLF